MNGYIQLELGGKVRGCKFGAAVIFDLVEKLGLSFESLNFQFDYKTISTIIYCGLVNNCNQKDEDPDFTEQDVAKWIDDLPLTKLTEVFTVFASKLGGEAEPAPKKGKK